MDNQVTVYEEGKGYQAKIVDQLLTKSNNDLSLQLILTIKILAMLKNAKSPADGTEECPQLEREAWITFPEDNDKRLYYATRDLERLGFSDPDLSKLHPEHLEFVSLVDKVVNVTMKTIDGLEYWNLAWPREKPTPLALGELQKTTNLLKDKIPVAKKKVKEELARKKAPDASGNNNNHDKPDIPF